MITASQVYAARVLAKLSREQLARKSQIDATTIADIEERGVTPTPAQADALVRALDAGGVEFIPEQGALGAGVRLKFSAQAVKSIDRFENEGGPARDDDVA